MTPALRLLHLEDDPADAELIAAALRADGFDFDVLRVDERQAFVAALQRGGFDLILADYSLPGFDGAAALALAQQLCPDVPVILVSGQIGEEAVVAVLHAGAHDVVTKARLGRLGPAIRRALREAQARLARQQAEQALVQQARRLRALADASRLFAEAGLDVEAVVEAVTQSVMRTIGDGCLLLLREGERWSRLMGLAHFDPQASALLRRLLAAGPLGGRFWHGPISLAQAPVFLPYAAPEQFRAALDPSLWPYLDRYGVRSLLAVPLGHTSSPTGVLAVWRDTSDVAYTQDDLAFLQDLAGRAALTIERARAHAQAQALNAELEERVRARTAELAQANARLEAEIALQRRVEQEFRQLLEAAPDAMVIANSQGEILLVNSQTETLFGFSRAELIGQPVERLLPERHHAAHRRHRAAYVARPAVRQMGAVQQLAGRRRDGQEFPVELSLSPLERPDGLLVLASIRDVTERRRAQAQLEDVGRQLRSLSARLQAAREDERARLAREVHDELGQELSSLRMDLAWIEKRLPPDQPALRDKAAAMAALLGAMIKTVRRITAELRPGQLDDFGLLAALEWQLQEFQSKSGLRCAFDARVPEVPLAPEKATAAFRVFQEILDNIRDHAQASSVAVSLEPSTASPDWVVLKVADDGRGISPAELADPRSLGLLGMRERLRAFSGELTIDGRPGQGTTVVVQIPLDAA